MSDLTDLIVTALEQIREFDLNRLLGILSKNGFTTDKDNIKQQRICINQLAAVLIKNFDKNNLIRLCQWFSTFEFIDQEIITKIRAELKTSQDSLRSHNSKISQLSIDQENSCSSSGDEYEKRHLSVTANENSARVQGIAQSLEVTVLLKQIRDMRQQILRLQSTNSKLMKTSGKQDTLQKEQLIELQSQNKQLHSAIDQQRAINMILQQQILDYQSKFIEKHKDYSPFDTQLNATQKFEENKFKNCQQKVVQLTAQLFQMTKYTNTLEETVTRTKKLQNAASFSENQLREALTEKLETAHQQQNFVDHSEFDLREKQYEQQIPKISDKLALNDELELDAQRKTNVEVQNLQRTCDFLKKQISLLEKGHSMTVQRLTKENAELQAELLGQYDAKIAFQQKYEDSQHQIKVVSKSLQLAITQQTESSNKDLTVIAALQDEVGRLTQLLQDKNDAINTWDNGFQSTSPLNDESD